MNKEEGILAEFYEELHANPFVAQFDVLSYLRDWLIHHICVEDIQLIKLTKKKSKMRSTVQGHTAN